MLLIKLFNLFKGYVVILVKGTFPERFLNLCTRRKIFLWNIKREENMTANISIQDFKRLKEISKKSFCRIHIIKKVGLPFFIYKHKKRKAMVIGIVGIAVVLYIMSYFVWAVQIIGNTNISYDLLEQELYNAGVKSGVLRKNIDTYSVRNKLMINIPELSWMSVNIKGTTAVVEIKERNILPPAFPKDQPCSIVAKTGGVIEVANVVEGERLISPGDVVQKGQILVSGVLEGDLAGIRYVHSDGDIVATTWHEKTFDLPMYKEVKNYTGKEKSKHSLKILDFCVKLYIDGEVSYENYERKTFEKRLSLGNGFVLPLSFNYDKYFEQTVSKIKMTEKEAVEETYKLMDNELKETKIINRQYEIKNNKLKVIYTCRENIVEKVGFEFDSY